MDKSDLPKPTWGAAFVAKSDRLLQYVFGLPFFVILSPVLIACMIVGALRHYRERKLLRKQGRVLDFHTAVEMTRAGTGTLFVTRNYPDGIGEIWWVEGTRQSIDPAGRLPIWNPSEPPVARVDLDHALRDRLNAFSKQAKWVDGKGVSEKQQYEQLRGLPAVESCTIRFLAMAPEAEDPFPNPLDDPALESLRRERESLLDAMLNLIANAEYDLAHVAKRRAAALKQRLRAGRASPQR